MSQTLPRPTAAPSHDRAAGERAVVGTASRSAPSARASAWTAVLAVVVAVALAPFGGTGGLPAGVAARLRAGQLERLDGQRWVPVAVDGTVPEGARVRTADGRASLAVAGGTLELAPATEAALTRTRTALAGGSVLVESSRSRTVTRGTVTASGQGAWRVDADGAPRVGVYRGGVAVSDAQGRQVAVGRLAEVSLVDGAPGARALPLRYRSSDPWDARLVASAIAVDRQASRLTASLAASYGPAVRPAAFYADFATPADRPALTALAPAVDGAGFGPPADVLLGLVVVDMLRTREAMTAAAALDEVTGLRRDGARWGLVLARHGLDSGDLRAAADRALRRQQAAGGPTGRAAGAGTAAGDVAAGGAGAPPATTPTTEPTPPPGDTSSPGDEPGPGSEPGPLDPVDPVIDEADGAVGDVPGGPAAVDAARTVVDTVDDLLSGPTGQATAILPP